MPDTVHDPPRRAEPTGEARLSEAKVAMYRAVILDVAEELFAQEGFDRAAVRVVASRAGISLTTLYAHFPNKLELYRGVHARRLGDLMRVAVRAPDAAADALDRLVGAVDGYVAFHVAHPAYLRMHLRDGNAWSVREGLRTEEQAAAWTRGQSAMVRAFRDGIRDGLFVEEDPVWMARSTNALHQVALTLWAEGGGKLPLRDLLSRVRAQFVRTFCQPSRVPELLERVGKRPPPGAA